MEKIVLFSGVVVLLSCLLLACGDNSSSTPAAKPTKTLLDPQMQNLQKARDVENVMEQDANRLKAETNKQTQ